jgi:hypothetical protein
MPEYLHLLDPVFAKRFATSIPLNIQEYQRLFSKARINQQCGEASTSYFLFPQIAIPKILSLIADAKIVIILRNPFERAWSEFQMEKRHIHVRNPSEYFITEVNQALASAERWMPQFIEQSLYSSRLQSFRDNFSSVHVVVLDDFVRNAHNVLNSLYSFLGVDPNQGTYELQHSNRGEGFLQAPHTILKLRQLLRRLGSGKILKYSGQSQAKRIRKTVRKVLYRQHALPESVKEVLRPIFEPDIRILEGLLKRNLSFWL